MQFSHNGIEYTLDDQWWAEAGMTGFVPSGRSFRAGASTFPDLVPFEVAIDDVQPLNRKGSHGVFNDSEPGRQEGTARERVLRILKWLRDDSPFSEGFGDLIVGQRKKKDASASNLPHWTKAHDLPLPVVFFQIEEVTTAKPMVGDK